MKILSIPLVRIFSFNFLLLILISGCSRKEADFQPIDTSAAFPAPATFQQLDIRLQKIIRALQSKPTIKADFCTLIENKGNLVWNKSLISLRINTLVALIPLKKEKETSFEAFVAIELDSSLRFKIFDQKNFMTYAAKGNSEGPSLFDINHALNALNHYGFGRTIYSTTGLPARELKKLESYKRNSRIEPQQNSMASVITISTCYSWSACTGDGNGNCVGEIYYFTECVSETIWFKSFDLDYDMGGGYGYESGGGGGNSYYDPNIPSSAEDMKKVQVIPPLLPIADIQKYLSCFVRTAPAKVRIYADQPVDGTTEPVSILGGIGHTYMSFEQNVNGMNIRRTVGFYNQTKVDPVFNKSAPSVLGNDSMREYNIYWETDLSPDQFDGMLQATLNYEPVYDIEKYNCTNFVLDVASAGGINLPRSVGWWYTGSGLNPGAFGEDLRRQPGAVSGKGYTEDNEGECP